MISRRVAPIGLILMYVTTLPVAATSATPQIADTADQVVSLTNVTAKEDEVAGEAVNNSRQTLRDVQLRILYIRGVGTMNFAQGGMIPEELSIRPSTEKYHQARARGSTISPRRRCLIGKMAISM